MKKLKNISLLFCFAIVASCGNRVAIAEGRGVFFMRYNFDQLSGKKIHRLTILSEGDLQVGSTGLKKRTAVCLCECGNTKTILVSSILDGNTKSCGCAKTESTILNGIKNKTHGGTYTPEYNVWSKMKDRCNNPNDPRYKWYGGRGIRVCERWSDFANFIEDMGKRPGKEYSIDRVDNNGNYEPGNCKWATQKEQCRNKGNNRIVSFRGRDVCVSELAEMIGMDVSKLHYRIFRAKWSVERAIDKTHGNFKNLKDAIL